MSNQLLYVPALRTKIGEFRGLHRLKEDIKSHIKPRLVIAPPKEFDPDKQRFLTKDEIVYGPGHNISNNWKMRPAYLEATYLFGDFGEQDCADWLPRFFEVARRNNSTITPVASLSDLTGERKNAFIKCIDQSNRTKMAIRIETGDVDSDLGGLIKGIMNDLGLDPSQCDVFADFCNDDFSNITAVSEVAQAVLQELQSIGLWQNVIFQGSNYSTSNPATHNETVSVPRNEWLAWQKAVRFDANTANHLIFGDYGADCSEFSFPKMSGGRAIRHYRYATDDEWLVVRAAQKGTDEELLKTVCKRIVNHAKFAGREFSDADNYIYMSANGLDGPGNASTWREMNTAHHITKVVKDLGKIKGMAFEKISTYEDQEQFELIE